MRKFLGFIFSMTVIIGSLSMGFNSYNSMKAGEYGNTTVNSYVTESSAQRETEIPIYAAETDTIANTATADTTASTTSTVSDADSTAAAVEVDSRAANYTGTPNYQTFTYSWISNRGEQLTFSVSLDVNAYAYYSSLERYLCAEDLYRYAKDETSVQIAKQIADAFNGYLPAAGYSNREIVEEAINFVQQCFTYEYDTVKGQPEYPKYLIETMVDRTGDCEDTSLLLCSIVKQLGYGAVLLDYPGHVAVGLQFEQGSSQTGRYYDYNGKRFYYIETTNTGWIIGQMPDEYIGKSVEIREIY